MNALVQILIFLHTCSWALPKENLDSEASTIDTTCLALASHDQLTPQEECVELSPLCSVSPAASKSFDAPSKQLKSNFPAQKRKKTIVKIDDINEMHLCVLKKESLKLDMEMENLLLQRKEINLRIEQLQAKACNASILDY